VLLQPGDALSGSRSFSRCLTATPYREASEEIRRRRGDHQEIIVDEHPVRRASTWAAAFFLSTVLTVTLLLAQVPQ
jgi:hypothetical protein